MPIMKRQSVLFTLPDSSHDILPNQCILSILPQVHWQKKGGLLSGCVWVCLWCSFQNDLMGARYWFIYDSCYLNFKPTAVSCHIDALCFSQCNNWFPDRFSTSVSKYTRKTTKAIFTINTYSEQGKVKLFLLKSAANISCWHLAHSCFFTNSRTLWRHLIW